MIQVKRGTLSMMSFSNFQPRDVQQMKTDCRKMCEMIDLSYHLRGRLDVEMARVLISLFKVSRTDRIGMFLIYCHAL